MEEVRNDHQVIDTGPPRPAALGLIFAVLDRAIGFVQSSEFGPAVEEAKAESFGRTGVPGEDESGAFARHWDCFWEHFLVDRVDGASGLRPIDIFLREAEGLEEEERIAGQALAAARPTLLRVGWALRRPPPLVDLAYGIKRRPDPDSLPPGLTRGQVISGRVVELGGEEFLSRGSLVHPTSVSGGIVKRLHRCPRTEGGLRALLLDVEERYRRYERFLLFDRSSRVDPRRVYEDDLK